MHPKSGTRRRASRGGGVPRACWQRLLAAPLLLLAVFAAAAEAAQAGGWQLGRATFYGGPSYFTGAFDKARGVGSFGILEQGSCGFTNSDGSLPFPRDAVAAAADANPDYAGSCGRCYEVRCRSGLVLDNDGNPVNFTSAGLIYLPSVSRTLPDTSGRAWPGNDKEAEGLVDTRCWRVGGETSKMPEGVSDEGRTVVVRVIDTCPCRQVLPSGAPGVKAGGEVRRQGVCCGGSAGIRHFDLSFWAFEQLAHPLYGQQMLEYRLVDCGTGAPLPDNFVDRTAIYRGGATGAGWGWFVYGGSFFHYAVPGAGPGGGAATCVELTPSGGLSFSVKQGASLSPFGGAAALSFSLRSGRPPAAAGADPPHLKLFILNDEAKKYCNAEPLLAPAANGTRDGAAAGPGGWRRYRVPFAAFACDYDGALPAQVDRLDFQNPTQDSVSFCLDDLTIDR